VVKTRKDRAQDLNEATDEQSDLDKRSTHLKGIVGRIEWEKAQDAWLLYVLGK
jgi:hypothetical protein